LGVRYEPQHDYAQHNNKTLGFLRHPNLRSFKKGELARDEVCAKNAYTANDGKTHQAKHFNLDVVISVGCRVKSQL